MDDYPETQYRPHGGEGGAMIERTSIDVVRYRDGDGHPTCAKNFNAGEVCIFYATQKLGCHETCWFADKDSRRWVPLERRKDEYGTLIPLASCPIWKGEI